MESGELIDYLAEVSMTCLYSNWPKILGLIR